MREPAGSPKFQVASFHACHDFEPRRADDRLTNSPAIVLTSEHVKTVVTRIYTPRLNCLWGLRIPCGLHVSLCTLRSNRFAVLPSVFRRLPVPINKGDPPHFNDLPVFERNTRLFLFGYYFETSGLAPDKKRLNSLGARM